MVSILSLPAYTGAVQSQGSKGEGKKLNEETKGEESIGGGS